MNDLSIISPSFDKQLVTSYIMSIQLRLDGLSFLIYDAITNTYIAIGNTDFEQVDTNFAKHEEYMLRNDIFLYKYKKIIISVDSQVYTMLPISVYDADKADKLLNFIGNNEISKDDKVQVDFVNIAEAAILYHIPQFLYYFLYSQYSNVSIVHITRPIIESMLTKRLTDKKNVVNIVFDNSRIRIIVAEDNILKQSTFYQSVEVNDVVYIVMNTLEQLQINNNDVQIIISGNVDADNECVKLIKKFAHNVVVAQLPTYFKYGFQVLNEQKYYNLFLIPLCE